MTEGNIHKKAMIEALEKSLGVVTTACEVVGISRKTHYEWMKTDPEYKEAVEDISEAAIDFVESKLHDRIKEKDTTSIIFFLKTKAKKRGYVERQEVEQSGGLTINWKEERTYETK